VLIVLILIWLYTNKSGIKTIVWTDALQSFFLVTVIIVSILMIKRSMGLGFGDLLSTVTNHPYSKLFNWDLSAGSNFFKQFISGMLITIALVGLDQSMMQKSLTVSKLKDARKNVLSFSFFIAFAQMLFLSLGVLLYAYMEQKGIAWPAMDGRFLKTDEIYPFLTQNYFGIVGAMAFFIGVVASTFATIDSCITALTTAFSYDFLNFDNKSHEQRVKIKNSVLLGVNFVIFLIVIWFWNSQGAIINTIFKVAGYTYGPILGLYLLGLFTKIKLKEVWVPLACVAAAAITYWLNGWMIDTHNFDFGFMNILVNALLTILFLLIIKKK
jgi:Na+/proline symporter